MASNDEIVRQLTDNGVALRALVQAFSEEHTLWKPTPETWSLKDVVEHLYNEERLDFRRHLKDMLGEPPQPGEYTRVESCRQALAGFLAERDASIAWLGALETLDWDKTTTLPFGPSDTLTLRAGDLLASWVEHDFLHMRQMVELLHGWNESQAAPYSVQYAGGW